MSEPKWYVIHTYSGYENKVADSIEKIVVTEDSVKNSTQPLLLTNKSRKPIVLHAKDIKNA